MPSLLRSAVRAPYAAFRVLLGTLFSITATVLVLFGALFIVLAMLCSEKSRTMRLASAYPTCRRSYEELPRT
jgi:hypothetical protein